MCQCTYNSLYLNVCVFSLRCVCMCVSVRGWKSYDMWQLVGRCQRGRMEQRRKRLLPQQRWAGVADGRVAWSSCQLRQWELQRQQCKWFAVIIMIREQHGSGTRFMPQRHMCRRRWQQQTITLPRHSKGPLTPPVSPPTIISTLSPLQKKKENVAAVARQSYTRAANRHIDHHHQWTTFTSSEIWCKSSWAASPPEYYSADSRIKICSACSDTGQTPVGHDTGALNFTCSCPLISRETDRDTCLGHEL